MAITRTQSASGTVAGGTSITVTLGGSPANGSRIILVVVTSGSTANRVSSISQTGATWSKAVESTNASGCTTEIWSTGFVSSGGAGITVNLAASLTAVAIAVEYANLSTTTDKTATNTGTHDITAAIDTGTTATTTSTNELWVGACGTSSDNGGTLNNPTNSFTEVVDTDQGAYRIAFEEKIVSSTGTANTAATPTIVAAGAWAGAIATFPQMIGAGIGASYIQHTHKDTYGARPR